MRCLTKEITNNVNPILEVEVKPKKLFLKAKIKFYQAIDNYVGSYYKWVELPDKTIVDDFTSFQLDAWLKELKRNQPKHL